jgi:hypothetical protein
VPLSLLLKPTLQSRHQIQTKKCPTETGPKAKSNKRAPEQAPALGAEHYPANIWALARWW